MRDLESPYKIHNTLTEIDRLIDDNYVDQDTLYRYRNIRGPWERLYNGNKI